jgi:shikimate kinase
LNVFSTERTDLLFYRIGQRLYHRRYNPLMTPVSRLILTGFMGAGKSTVGAILARDLGWRFIDLDDVIEASSQSSVADLFTNHGEAVFREWERHAVRQIGDYEQVVVALGGGAVEDESSRTLLLSTPGNILVFLDGELAELLARCTSEGRVRPLLSASESIAARHQRRLPYYRKAHLTVDTTGLEPQAVANHVVLEIRKRQTLG